MSLTSNNQNLKSKNQLGIGFKPTLLGSIIDKNKAKSLVSSMKPKQMLGFVQSIAGGFLNTDNITKSVKELKNLPVDKVNIPESFFEGAKGKQREDLKESYLKARDIILDALDNHKGADGILKPSKTIDFSFDGDGNIFDKTIGKTQNSDAMASYINKLSLRLVAWVNHHLGGTYEVNTQRVGFLASPSILGSEGEDILHNGKYHPSHRTVCQISNVWDEFGIYSTKDPMSKILGVKGLGSSMIHKPGQNLKINPKSIQFSEILDEINKKQNFLEKFENTVKDKGLRVIEYKSLPEYLVDTQGKTKLEDYVRFIELAKKSIDNKSVSDQKFAQGIKELNIPLSSKFEKLLSRLEDPADTEINKKTFTSAMRYGKIFCLVPHAINNYNIMDESAKLSLANNVIRSLRNPETKQFLQEKYSIDPQQDIVNVNGFDISHIDFSDDKPKNTITGKIYQDFNELAAELKTTGRKSPNSIIKIIANYPNPYFELTSNTDKQDDLGSIDQLKKNNRFLIGGEDSPSGTGLLAHSLLADGAAFIARGQIDLKEHIIGKVIELLQDPKYASHEFALEKTGDKFKILKDSSLFKAGEILNKEDLTEKLFKYFESKISKQNTVPLNTASLAGIFLEIAQKLKIPGLKEVVGLESEDSKDLKVDENAFWVKDFLKNRSSSAMSTPLLMGLEDRLKQEHNTKGGLKIPLSEQGGLSAVVAKIPGLGPLVSLEKPGNSFRTLFSLIATGLGVGGMAGMAAHIAHNKKAEDTSKFVEKAAYLAQTLVAGISFYLMSPHKFTLKTIGESFGALSDFFPKGSLPETILRPLCEINMAGIAEQEAMNANMSIDAPVDKKEYAKAFKNPDKYMEIRNVTSEVTLKRKEGIHFFRDKFLGGMLGKLGFVGDFASRIVPDVMTFGRLTQQFIEEPGLRRGILQNLHPFKDAGVGVRQGKNSGTKYLTPHSQPHILAATAAGTAGTATLAAILSKTPLKALSPWLARIANALPTIALANRAKNLALNVSGSPTRFTDIHGNQQKFNPQKAAKWQLLGSYLMGLGGIGRGLTPLAGHLQNIGLGALVMGMGQEFGNNLDDSEVFKNIHENRYFKQNPHNLHTESEKRIVSQSVANPISTGTNDTQA